MKKIYVLFMSSLLLLSCAKDDVSKPSEWPEWPTPSKPKIENAVLRGVNGETVVAAGDKVKFTAQVSDEYNDLVSFQLLVTMDGAEILNLSKGLSGRSAVIEEEATLPFVAGFQNGRPVAVSYTHLFNSWGRYSYLYSGWRNDAFHFFRGWKRKPGYAQLYQSFGIGRT